MPSPSAEILELLATHTGPMDYAAVFILLNTVAGGHYQDRYSEDEIRDCLRQLLAQGKIEAWSNDQPLAAAAVAPGETVCHFRRRSG